MVLVKDDMFQNVQVKTEVLNKFYGLLLKNIISRVHVIIYPLEVVLIVQLAPLILLKKAYSIFQLSKIIKFA